MNKKFLYTVAVIIVLFLIGISMFLIINHKKDNIAHENPINNLEIDKEDENMQDLNKKILVLYFSATGTTEEVAKTIAEVTNADMIKIEPKNKYTSADLNYNNNDCRANKEQNDNSARPEIENQINIEGYDLIYIGYPIWWGTNPKIILSLLDNYNFNGKNVVLFCTSGSSDISQSISDLKNYNNQINFIDGKRFGSSTAKSEIETWVNALKK